MGDDRFDRLTDRQRACLRMVRDGRGTKEIAAHFSVSDHSIDKSIKLAMARLGVDRRAVAARLLAEYEAIAGVQKLDPQSPDLPEPSRLAIVEPSPGERVAAPMVREQRAMFEASLDGLATPPPSIDWGTEKREIKGARPRSSGVTSAIKLIALLAAALLLVCIAAFLLSGATYFYQVSHHLRQL